MTVHKILRREDNSYRDTLIKFSIQKKYFTVMLSDTLLKNQENKHRETKNLKRLTKRKNDLLSYHQSILDINDHLLFTS